MAESALQKFDESVMQAAWMQFGQQMIWILGYAADIFLDLYFAFVDVLNQYTKTEAELCCKTIGPILGKNDEGCNRHYLRYTMGFGRNVTECVENFQETKYYKEIYFLGTFPSKINCYSSMFWLSITALFGAYIVYSWACIWLIYISDIPAFEDFRKDIRRTHKDPAKNESAQVKKHFWWFWGLVILGLGPNYFLWRDMSRDWKNLKGNTIREKLKQKTLIWTDTYIHTLHLIHTMLEDIPLLILYLYLCLRHYDTFVKNSISFWPTVLSSLIFFIQDYSHWLVSVTKKDKTDSEGTQIFLYNSGYILLQLMQWIPMILAFDVLINWNASDGVTYKTKGCAVTYPQEIQDIKGSRAIVGIIYACMGVRLLFGWGMAFYKVVITAKEYYEDKKLSKEFGKLTFRAIWGHTVMFWKVVWGLARYLLVYSLGLPVYNIVAFAGGVNRTLLNSALFAIQYSVVFGLMAFSSHKGFVSYLDHVIVGREINDNYASKWEIAAITVGCLLIVLSWFLFWITFSWSRDPKKKNFLDNDIDYMNRNILGKLT